jgi:hypothetical protein
MFYQDIENTKEHLKMNTSSVLVVQSVSGSGKDGEFVQSLFFFLTQIILKEYKPHCTSFCDCKL